MDGHFNVNVLCNGSFVGEAGAGVAVALAVAVEGGGTTGRSVCRAQPRQQSAYAASIQQRTTANSFLHPMRKHMS
jgi:hypothetical protein